MTSPHPPALPEDAFVWDALIGSGFADALQEGLARAAHRTRLQDFATDPPAPGGGDAGHRLRARLPAPADQPALRKPRSAAARRHH
ncbi:MULTISPECIES: hypothetical protein [unclassified Kitasatospora]|uniref:hypothetical protein n=1 Tax=unclassified Kitasatospora TaxID=2633591 RepID=UPI001AE05822|nr:hypothetical protein [Kitasatospora sp. RG8]MBP0451919.1 hypothetical protein [Kitasatospora sp. RG8]